MPSSQPRGARMPFPSTNGWGMPAPPSSIRVLLYTVSLSPLMVTCTYTYHAIYYQLCSRMYWLNGFKPSLGMTVLIQSVGGIEGGRKWRGRGHTKSPSTGDDSPSPCCKIAFFKAPDCKATDSLLQQMHTNRNVPNLCIFTCIK